jgi:hypothetical protein
VLSLGLAEAIVTLGRHARCSSQAGADAHPACGARFTRKQARDQGFATAASIPSDMKLILES